MNLKNKVAPRAPSEKQLQAAYNTLLGGTVFVSDLADLSQWIRFDPRLGEYFYSFFEKNWRKINPVELNQCLSRLFWPQVLMVVLEQLVFFKKDRKLALWKECVQDGLIKARSELYFIGLWKPASRFLYEEAELSTVPYLKWGYLGNQSFKQMKSASGYSTLLPAKTRKYFLKKLLQSKTRVTVKEYQESLKNLVSRKQAQRDLAELEMKSKIRKMGNTKGRFYRTGA